MKCERTRSTRTAEREKERGRPGGRGGQTGDRRIIKSKWSRLLAHGQPKKYKKKQRKTSQKKQKKKIVTVA